MAHRVLFVVSSHRELGNTGRETGYYLSEVTHPHRELIDAGYQVDFVSPGGKRPAMDPGSLDRNDPVNSAFLDDPKWKDWLDHPKSPNAIEAADYAAIFYAGGHGAMWDFPDDMELVALARAIYENGGIVAAVCHGPAGLVNLTLADGSTLVDGRQVACFTNEEEETTGLRDVVPFLLQDRLQERGAHHAGAAPFKPYVVVDGRLVTGQNPASAKGVGETIVGLLRVTPEARRTRNEPAASREWSAMEPDR